MASLGNDLAAIRTGQGLSIEDIQKITKLTPNILRSIEDNSIFERKDINMTYVRSFVRNYAKALQIEESDIVRALNQVETHRYEGELGMLIAKGAINKDTAKKDMIHDHSPKYSSLRTDINSPQNSHKIEKKPFSYNLSSVDWADVGRKANPTPSKNRISTGLLLVLLFAVLALIIMLLYSYLNNDSSGNNTSAPQSNVQQPIIPADSLKESLLVNKNSSEYSIPVAATEPLPDTLSITVTARSGKLEPVRVYTDIMENRNPYWIEPGDSLRFNFIDTFRVRAFNQYDRLVLLYNGNEINNYLEEYYNSETKMVELSRAVFKNPLWNDTAVETETLSAKDS